MIVSLAAALAATANAQQEAEDPDPPRDPPAQAQPGRQPRSPEAAEPEEDPADRQISLQVELRPWFVAPGGRYVLPGETRGGRDIDVEDLNIDGARLSPAGRVRLEVDEWSFAVAGARVGADRRTNSPVTRPIGDIDIAQGDALRTQMRYTTAELLVGNTFFQRSLHAFDYPESRFGLELEAGLGARFDRFDIRLEREAGGEARADELFLMPLAAFEARFKPSPRTTLSFAVTAGWNPGLGDQTAVTTDLIVRTGWQVLPRVQAIAGYRITIQRMESGDGPQRFEFNGSHAGLYGGLRIGF